MNIIRIGFWSQHIQLRVPTRYRIRYRIGLAENHHRLASCSTVFYRCLLQGSTQILRNRERRVPEWCQLLYFEGVVFWAVSCRDARRFYEIPYRTKASWCQMLYFERVVLWAVSCRDIRWYLRNRERRVPYVSCHIFNEWFYELCPAGTYADMYETENEGFLMPKLLYFEGVVYELFPAGTHTDSTKYRTKSSWCQLLYYEGVVLWAVSCRDARWYLRNRGRGPVRVGCWRIHL